MRIVAATILSLAVAAAAQAPPPIMTPEDLLGVQTFAGGQPIALSPTGRAIAYVLTDLADEWNIQEPRPTGHVIVQTLTGGQAGRPRALTSGAMQSSFPVWSPDGRRLAFVREEARVDRSFSSGVSESRLALWDAEQGVATPVGEPFRARPYLAPQWDQSGRRIVFALPLPEEKPNSYRVRVVKSADARIPGDEFFADSRQAVLVSIDAGSGKHTLVIQDPILVRSFRLSPDGRHLVFVAPSPETFGIIGKEENETFLVSLDADLPAKPRKLQGMTGDRQLGAGRFSWAPDGRLLVAAGGKLMTVPLGRGDPTSFLDGLKIAVSDPSWSPDGARFLTLVPDPTVKDPEIEPAAPGMYSIAQPFMDLHLVSGADGSSRNLTAAFEDRVSDPEWSPDGRAVYFRAIDNQTYRETIYRYTVATEKLDPLTGGEESYGQLSAGPGVVALAIEDATHSRDLWLLDASSGARRRITELNPQLAKFRFSKPELFYFHNADGERLGALLYRPAGLPPGQKVPVITWVYEKMTPAVHRFNARDQMFLSHGYAMLMPNVKVRVGQTADSFVTCVVPAVNAVREMGFTNGRFGLWGHSFGAYATSNLITRTGIFAAAVSGATPPELFRNWASGRDRDSRNIEVGQARMGGSPFEYPERYFSQSAFFHLDKVTTPVLILHGEKDYTILFGEGEMMFYALRRLGKTAEFVAYANGDHSLSRHSREDALDVNRRILAWFEKYLKTGAGDKTQ